MRRTVTTALVAGVLTTCVPVTGHAAPGCAPPEDTLAQAESWAQRRIAPARAWPLTEGAQRVAVVDTGVSAAAPALAGAVLPGTDLGTGRGDSDCSGHGTFLAGLLAARPSKGVPFAGVAPAAQVLPVRVTDDPAQVDPARLARGVRAAVDGGARIIAIGLTTTVDDLRLRAEVATAIDRDIVVVASAATPREGQKAYPAALPGVLAVAPTGPTGPPRNVRLGAEPVLAGPAEQLVGIGPSGAGHRTGSAPELAVAYVAGAAALVRDYHPDLSARDVAARLVATADPPAGELPDALVGNGVVDPVAAVTSVLDTGGAVREGPAERLVLSLPPQPDLGPVRRASVFAAVLLACAAAIGAVSVLRALGRRRTPDHAGEIPTSG